jgi:SAM-dependent methyltransferase
MYALLQRYFTLGGKTADIGCGTGRDVAWLNDHGFPAVGYDAAEGLLARAAAEFPSLVFKRAALPALDDIGRDTYDNVLCETVVMHLPPDEVTQACARLFDILRPAGTLYLSWRVAESFPPVMPLADSMLSSTPHG